MDIKTMSYDELLAKRKKNEERLDEINKDLKASETKLDKLGAGRINAFDTIIHSLVNGSEFAQASRDASAKLIRDHISKLILEANNITNENKELDKQIDILERSSETIQYRLIKNKSLDELNKEINDLDKKIINIDETKRRFDPHTRNEMEKDRERMASYNDMLKKEAGNKKIRIDELKKEHAELKAEIKIDKDHIQKLEKTLKNGVSKLNLEVDRRKGLSEAEREALGESTQGQRDRNSGYDNHLEDLRSKVEERRQALENNENETSMLKEGPKESKKSSLKKVFQFGRA